VLAPRRRASGIAGLQSSCCSVPPNTNFKIGVADAAGLERGSRITGFGGHGRGGFGPTHGDTDADGQQDPAAAEGQRPGQNTAGGDARRGPSRTPPVVLDVDRRVFARILLSPDTLADHLPDTYLAHLQQL